MGEERAQRRNDSALLLAEGGNHRLRAGVLRLQKAVRCSNTLAMTIVDEA